MEDENQIFCCYLLRSLDPDHKNSSYIGFTVDPNRRLKQHNGEIKNGALATRSRRPWRIVILVYGFTSKISALHFEWTWQHPSKSRLTKQSGEIFKKIIIGTEKRIETLFKLISILPWSNLPLKLNWFDKDYMFCGFKNVIPDHIEITHFSIDSFGGEVLCKFLEKRDQIIKIFSTKKLIDSSITINYSEKNKILIKCSLCNNENGFDLENKIFTFCKDCNCIYHVICLGKKFYNSVDNNNKILISPKGKCLKCKKNMFWSSFVENSKFDDIIKDKVIKRNYELNLLESNEKDLNASIECFNLNSSAMDSDIDLITKPSLRDRIGGV